MSDPYIANVSLLLPFTGSDNSTTIIDYSPSSKTISVIDGAKISTSVNDPWGNNVGVASFDGSADGITFPNSSDFDFSSGDFTLEFWAYREGVNANYSRIYNPDGDYYNGTALAVDPSGNLLSFGTSDGNIDSWNLWSNPAPVMMPANTWIYFALVRNGTTVTLYSGTSGSTTSYAIATLASGTTLFQTSQTNLCIGGQHGANRSFYGKLSNFRITKGIARDCSTVPSSAFTLDTSLTIPISGQSISNYVNSFVTNCDKEIPSVDVTLSNGSISGEYSFNIVGQNFTIEHSDVKPINDISLIGLETSLVQGTISLALGTDLTIDVTGQEIGLSIGSVSPVLHKDITGEESSLTQGNIFSSVSVASSVNQITFTQGNHSVSVSLNSLGQTLLSHQGILTIPLIALLNERAYTILAEDRIYLILPEDRGYQI